MRNPADTGHAEWVHKASTFTQHLGLEVLEFGSGRCRTRLPMREELLNQGRIAHGGLYGVVADHTAGMAASTVVGDGERVLTVEYKVSIYRPGDCVELLTEGTVVKSGPRLVFGEAVIEGLTTDGGKVLLSRSSLTFAVVPRRPAPGG